MVSNRGVTIIDQIDNRSRLSLIVIDRSKFNFRSIRQILMYHIYMYNTYCFYIGCHSLELNLLNLIMYSDELVDEDENKKKVPLKAINESGNSVTV